MSAAAAFRIATSRKGLCLHFNTLSKALALCSASPPRKASGFERLRLASSGLTSKVLILPFSSAATVVEPAVVISSSPSEPCTTQMLSAPRFFSTWAIGSTHCLEKVRSEEHTSELQSLRHLVCRLLLEKK